MADSHSPALSLPRFQSLATVIAWILVVAFVVFTPTAAAGQDNRPKADQAEQPDEGAKPEGNKERKNRKNRKNKDDADAGGDGGGHESNYFGISTTGKEIIYVLDNSNSMSGGRFNAAAAELLASVKNLRDDQSYYVVLFSDTAYRLGHPEPAKGHA